MKLLFTLWLYLFTTNLFAQSNLIKWKVLDTIGLGRRTDASNFKRLQVGDLVDNLEFSTWFVDSFGYPDKRDLERM